MSKNKGQVESADTSAAFLIAEPLGYGARTDFKAAGVSLAMAPIANRPAIDYMIENLIRNGIRKIVILSSSQDEVNAIRKHISKAWEHASGLSRIAASSSAGNSAHNGGSTSGSQKKHRSAGGDVDSIEVRRCPLENGCFDVLTHIKNEDLVREGQYFCIVPMDAISNIGNLKALINKAIDRHVNHKLILTAIVRQDDYSIRSVYDAVMRREIERLNVPREDEDAHLTSINTPFNPKSMWDSLVGLGDDDELFMEEKAFAPRCTISFDPANGMVHGFKEWKRMGDAELDTYREENGYGEDSYLEAPYQPMPSIPIKRNGDRIAVRTDLMLTGIVVCSSDVINASFNTYQKTVSEFVNEFIACQIQWNLDIAIDVADSSATVCPISSLPALLAANQRVCARYLHPMTRDSNFGDHVAVKYAPSRRAPLLCVPEEGCPLLRGTIEGTGAFGLNAALHESSYVSNSSFGDHVMVGEKVRIINSIIGKNVKINAGAVIVNSMILDNAVVPMNSEIQNSIFAVTHPDTGAFAAKKKTRHNRLITNADGTTTELVIDEVISTYEMLTSDNIAGGGDDDDEEEDPEQWKYVLWDSYLNNKDVEGALEVGLKDLRISSHKTNTQLVQAMFEVLLINLGKMAKAHHLQLKQEKADRKARGEANSDDDEDEEDEDSSDDDEDDSFVADWPFVKEELVKKLSLWERDVLWAFISLGDTEDAYFILRGLSIGLAKTPCLHPYAGKILAIFYCLLDEGLFDKRDFCVIPAQALIAFLDEMEKDDDDDDEDDESSEDDDDSDDSSDDESDDEDNEEDLVALGWRHFIKYSSQVRAAFEEDSDEDEDEDDE